MSIARRIIFLAFTLFVTAATGAAAAPATATLDAHLQRQVKRGSRNERVIVRTKPGHRAAVAQTLRQRGHAVYGDHPGIEALSANVSAATLKLLANDPAVESISTDADIDSLDAKKS